MGSILELTTDLRSLRSQTYTGRKPYVSTTLPADFNAPPPKTPNTLELAAEARQDDASRLVQLLKDRPGLTYLAKQGLLSFAESGKIGKALKDVAATAVTLITQATLSGTGFHGSVDIITGNTYLPVNTTGNSKTIIPDNKLINGTIQKGIPDVGNLDKGQGSQPLGSPYGVGYKFGVNYTNTGPSEIEQRYVPSLVKKELLEGESEVFNSKTGTSTTRKTASFLGLENSPAYLNRDAGQLAKAKEQAKSYLENSKEIKLKMGSYKGIATRATLAGIDGLNYLEVTTTPLSSGYEIIPFRISVYEPGKETTYLYFRAYLETFEDRYNGEWNGTNYIGRAESIFNYTGFKRDIGFSFKIAASSELELLPLYKKLNHLVGTTAPSYSNTFMRGVFVKLTVGDYLKEVPGFFSSINLSWDKNYPWEINNEPNDKIIGTPSVPHILDVSISFTPIHNFTPAIEQPFITDSFTQILSKIPIPTEVTRKDTTVPEDVPATSNIVNFESLEIQTFIEGEQLREELGDVIYEGYNKWYDQNVIQKNRLEKARREVTERGVFNQPLPFPPTEATALTLQQSSIQISPEELKSRLRQGENLTQNNQLPTTFR
jgi:hypothetical protein